MKYLERDCTMKKTKKYKKILNKILENEMTWKYKKILKKRLKNEMIEPCQKKERKKVRIIKQSIYNHMLKKQEKKRLVDEKISDDRILFGSEKY